MAKKLVLALPTFQKIYFNSTIMYKLYNILTSLLLLISTVGIAQPVIGTTDFAVVGTVNLVAVSSCVTTKTANTFGWLVSVNSTSNCGLNLSDASGGDGRMQYLVGFGTLTQATFGSNDGSEFALTELAWSISTPSFASIPMTFVGYKNGVPVPGATLTATSPPTFGPTYSTVVSFTSNLAFREVDDVRFTPGSSCSSILALEFLTIASPTAPCNGPALSVTSSSNVLCNGQSTGSATMVATVGSGFTYTWSPSGGNAASATGLSAGIYTLSSKNSTCTNISTKTVQITQPTALATSTAVTNVTCNGGINGVGTITASGGAGGYTYLWSNAATTSVIAGMLAGVYTATVTDANTCKSSKNVTIAQPSAIGTATGYTNVYCNGGSNGSATIAASGGTSPYTYTWSTASTSSVTTGLTAGSYMVRVIDANNCSSVTRTVNISQPPALVSSTAVTNALCNGAQGSATVTASGGVGATYSYTWSSGPTTSVEPTLLAGTYTVRVTDANNCTNTASVTITQPSVMVTSTALTNVACNGGTGSASLTATGGAGAYTYSWSSGATTSVISSALAGAYSATVTDANNCTSIKSVSITQPSALTTSTALTNALCNGGTGSASITASGGTGAYTYSWSSGATSSVISSALAGAYSATVTDANNCTSVKGAVITQPSALITSTAVTNALCNGATGSASLTASGGTGAYTYSWSSGATTSVISSALAGAYSATVTDANNCTSVKGAIITQPSALITSTAITNIACNGDSGSATLTASGGTGAYTYSWSSGATTSVISSALAGAYSATVTDANNCTSTKSAVITQPSALITSTAITNVLCNGGTGSASITASGGTGAYTYSWSNVATASVISSALAGAYSATVTDASNCTSINGVIITQPSALITSTALTNALCNGGTGSATLTASGGTGAYSYLWSNAATASVVAGLTTGVYTGTVTDANNCQSIKTVSIIVPSSITVTAAASSASICSGNGSTLTANASGGTGALTYTWVSGPVNPIFVVTPTTSAIYTVTVTDANACSSSKTVNVVVAYGPTIAVNNGTICAGQSFSIGATGGAVSYTYSGGSALVSPLINSSYTVTGTAANGCINTTGSVSQVSVNPLPVISISNYTICNGASVTFTPGGANSYTYTGGSAVVTPTTTSSYSITGTSLAGCVSATATVSTILVNSLPTITINSGTLCAGRSFTLNPSGASSYTITGGSNIVSPALTSTYGVSGTGTNGCVSAAAAVSSITVFALPTLTLNNGSICPGNSFTLNPSGASSYTYLNGGPVVNPGVTTTYSVTGTSSLGCPASNTVSAVVTVTNTLVVSISGTKIICNGEATQLTANGASTYSWNTSVTASTISLSPSVNTTYTVYGLSGTCANSAIVTITVNITPTVSVSGTNTLCTGESNYINGQRSKYIRLEQ